MTSSISTTTKLYVEGDKGKDICHHCKAIVSTTFQRRNVPFSDDNDKAVDILVSVCDACDSIAAIPAQSTPAIKAARKSVKSVI